MSQGGRPGAWDIYFRFRSLYISTHTGPGSGRQGVNFDLRMSKVFSYFWFDIAVLPAYSTYSIRKNGIVWSRFLIAMVCQLHRCLSIFERNHGTGQSVPLAWRREFEEKSSLKFVSCHISVH